MKGDIVSILESVISGSEDGEPVSGPNEFVPDERGSDAHEPLLVATVHGGSEADPGGKGAEPYADGGFVGLTSIMDEVFAGGVEYAPPFGGDAPEYGEDAETYGGDMDVGALMQEAMDTGGAVMPDTEAGPQAVTVAGGSWLDPDVPPLSDMVQDPMALRAALKKLLRG